MNADRLLAHFEQISDAPNAVDRLRRFVLDLAVRGKLVEQQGRWTEMPVGALGSWGSGGTPLKTHPEYYGGDIPWVVIGDLNDSLVLKTETHITQAGVDDSSAKLIEPGAVLIALYGSIGKMGIAGIRCTTNQAIAHCVPDGTKVTRDYLFLLLKSMRHSLLAKGQGVAQQNISQKILKAVTVALPSLPEQHRIVEKVDELMELCDRLEASQKEQESRRDRLVMASFNRLSQPRDPEEFKKDAGFQLSNLNRLSTKPEHIKEIRKAILNLAVRGKLVPQDENDDRPPTALQLEDETEAHGADRPTHLRYLTTEDERHPIPCSWLWTRLGMIGDWGSGTTPSRGKAEYFGGSVSWFKSGELNDNPHLTGSDECVTPLALKECAFRRNKPGDVLFAMYGATIGKVAILAEEAVTNQAVVACTPCAHLSNQYLFLFLRSQRQRFHMASEGGAQPNVSKAKVIRCPIPLPPLAEQKRIVAKVDELMLICDQLENQLDNQQKGRRQLLEALLHKALEGVGSGCRPAVQA